jgi:cytidyltransferase-like protein
MKLVLITGGFDPLHSGHISYINAAKKLGDKLVVGINSDEWLKRKKGKYFLPSIERKIILESIKGVDIVIEFDDRDNTAKDSIRVLRKLYPDDKIIFANGGDRTKTNIPEMDIIDENLEFIFSVGGDDKKNSSSWILNNWANT